VLSLGQAAWHAWALQRFTLYSACGSRHCQVAAMNDAPKELRMSSILAKKLWKKAIVTAVGSLETTDGKFLSNLRHLQPLDSTLTSLNLSESNLRSNDAIKLADYLPSTTQLSFLDLSFNKLPTGKRPGSDKKYIRDDEGLQKLIEALRVHRSLIAVNMLGNDLDEVEARDLIGVVRHHKWLQSICGVAPKMHGVYMAKKGLKGADLIMLAAELDGGTDRISFLDTNAAILIGDIDFPAEEGSEGCLHDPLQRIEPECRYEVKVKRDPQSDYEKPTQVLYVHTLGRYLHFRRMLVHLDLSGNNLCEPNYRGLKDFFLALANNWTLKSLVGAACSSPLHPSLPPPPPTPSQLHLCASSSLSPHPSHLTPLPSTSQEPVVQPTWRFRARQRGQLRIPSPRRLVQESDHERFPSEPEPVG
jgi:hypothetical protein